jgi:hypothetical protein
MKTKFILLITLILATLSMVAQPNILWQKNLGGQNYDEANAVKQTMDGGYIVAGHSSSSNYDVSQNNGGKDIWVVKLDESGTIIWEHSYGGSENDVANDIIQTNDGGYIVIGTSESDDFNGITGHNGFEDMVVLKLDNLGLQEWGKFHGSSNNDRGLSIKQTSDGGYITAGLEGAEGTFQFWVAKLISNGDLDNTWAVTTFGDQYNDSANDVIQTNDGGYLAVGFAKYAVQGFGIETDFWVNKFDAFGNVEWSQLFGGTGTDLANTVQQTSDGGYIVAGSTRSNDGTATNYHGKTDIWVVKINALGGLEWQNALGGSEDEEATSVFETVDGNFIVSGTTQSIDGDVSTPIATIYDRDFWLIKMDANGVIVWDKAMGGSTEDYNYAAQPTEDGGYILAGTTNSQNFDVDETNGGYDFWVVKLEGDTLGVNDSMIKNGISVSPNPASDKISIQTFKLFISANIYSILGEHVYTTSRNEIDVSNYKSGIYLLKIKTEQGVFTKKIIIN